MQAAVIEDVDEMNALEYAIMSDAELRTVKLLQNADAKLCSLGLDLDGVAALALALFLRSAHDEYQVQPSQWTFPPEVTQ